MGFLDNHRYSAVTDIINDCCGGDDPVGENGYIERQLGPLLDAIKLQKDYSEPGPVEAARAIRKKLKYGSTKEQLKSLMLLDLLVVNGGPKLKLLYNDDKLNDRLQVILLSTASATFKDAVSPKVRKLAYSLMENWAREFPNEPEMNQLITLYNRCLKNQANNLKKQEKKRRQQDNLVPDFMNDEAAEMDQDFFFDDERPRTNAELDKQFKIPKINMNKEKPKILDLIGKANITSTNLINSLNSLSPGELSIHSVKANDSFDKCRSTRRVILRYLQLVNQEELLGPLLKCNDDLVAALKRYEELSRVTGESDSDYNSLDDLESYAASSLNMNQQDSDDDDSYYSRRNERYPPAELEPEPEVSIRRPPPVPPKKSILKEQKIDYAVPRSDPKHAPVPAKNSRNPNDDYNPFSDDNEVTPSAWN